MGLLRVLRRLLGAGDGGRPGEATDADGAGTGRGEEPSDAAGAGAGAERVGDRDPTAGARGDERPDAGAGGDRSDVEAGDERSESDAGAGVGRGGVEAGDERSESDAGAGGGRGGSGPPGAVDAGDASGAHAAAPSGEASDDDAGIAGAGAGTAGDTDSDANGSGPGDGATDADGGDDPGPVSIAEAVGDGPAAFREQAAEFAAFQEGYDLDYTPGSIGRLDELFEAGREDPEYLRVELADGRSATFAPLATAAAAYFGETLVRSYGAEWVRDEDAGWVVEVPGTLETARTDVFSLAHRGLETGAPFVAAHGELLGGLDVTPAGGDAGGDGRSAGGTGDADAGGDGSGHPADDGRGGVGPTGDDDAGRDGAAPGPADFLGGVAGDAESLAAARPAYELDFSPASLERLDELVRAETDSGGHEGADRDGAAGSDGPGEGGDADGAGEGGDGAGEGGEAAVTPTACGAYLATVLRRSAGAEWTDTDEGLVLAVPGGDRVDPVAVAVDCLRGEGSFADAYRDAVGEAVSEESPDGGGDAGDR